MCILLVAYRQHPVYDLIVAANRDEFYSRASTAAEFWQQHPEVLAGRDELAGGTWLGVNRRGHFAAVTNLRGGGVAHDGFSRGHLVRDFLLRQDTARQYAEALAPQGRHYAGCNLLLADRERLWWWSNLAYRELPPGVYGVSNSPLDDEWPKVERLKAAFEPLRPLHGAALVGALLEVLRDAPTAHASPGDLLGARLEDTIFVHTATYGTRCTSLVLRDPRRGSLEFVERRFTAGAEIAGESRFVVDSLS